MSRRRGISLGGRYRTSRIEADGAYLGHIGGIIDIHDRRLAEQSLFFSNEQFKAAIKAERSGQIVFGWHRPQDGSGSTN